DEPHEDLIAELLAEDAISGSFEYAKDCPPGERHAQDPTPEEFAGPEHKAIGDQASGGEASSILYGSPPRPLSFADVVALAGDYFGEYEELAELGLTEPGRRRLEWARWHCLDLPASSEPKVGKAVTDTVMARYYQLAASNFSHYSAGGTA